MSKRSRDQQAIDWLWEGPADDEGDKEELPGGREMKEKNAGNPIPDRVAAQVEDFFRIAGAYNYRVYRNPREQIDRVEGQFANGREIDIFGGEFGPSVEVTLRERMLPFTDPAVTIQRLKQLMEDRQRIIKRGFELHEKSRADVIGGEYESSLSKGVNVRDCRKVTSEVKGVLRALGLIRWKGPSKQAGKDTRKKMAR